MRVIKIFIILIMLWVLAYVVTFNASDKEYKENGTKVIATISDIHSGARGRKSYECTYYNEQGQLVEAYLILNKLGGEIGDVVEGYYLKDTPNEVYCEPSKLLKYGIIVFVDAIAIFYTVFVVSCFFQKE